MTQSGQAEWKGEIP